jgi:hypothetical protein
MLPIVYPPFPKLTPKALTTLLFQPLGALTPPVAVPKLNAIL